MNGLKNELDGQLTIIKVDISSPAGKALSAEYGSRETPTFIYFDRAGEELWRQIGTIDANRVRSETSSQ